MITLEKHLLYYLGTPYSKYKDGIEQAFIEASRLAARLLCGGFKVYSPIAHTHPLAVYGQIDPYDHDVWLPFDEAMMRKCDALLVAKMAGWSESFGIKHEISWFLTSAKPVLYLHPGSLVVSDAAIAHGGLALAHSKSPSEQGGCSA